MIVNTTSPLVFPSVFFMWSVTVTLSNSTSKSRMHQSDVSLFTILLTTGTITNDVGKLTAKPVKKARTHLSKNSGTKPRFTKVRTRDIEKDMPKDMNAQNKTVEYLTLTLTATTSPQQPTYSTNPSYIYQRPSETKQRTDPPPPRLSVSPFLSMSICTILEP